jgi:hypothetical protein
VETTESRQDWQNSRNEVTQVRAVVIIWFDDCSKIGYIGYIVGCKWFSRQHLGNTKSYKELHYRYRYGCKFLSHRWTQIGTDERWTYGATGENEDDISFKMFTLFTLLKINNLNVYT